MAWWIMARTPLSPVEVDEVWRRWRSGQAVKVLAREMRRHPSTVRDLLTRCGAVRPAPRRRCELRLSLGEREEISRGLAAGASLRSIARQLHRAPSTISREVARQGGRAGSGCGGRGNGMVTGQPTQAHQAVAVSRAGGHGRGEAGRTLVATADRWMAAAPVPDEHSGAGVARDDLPVAVRAGPR
jgi:Helix-turn-helix domain